MRVVASPLLIQNRLLRSERQSLLYRDYEGIDSRILYIRDREMTPVYFSRIENHSLAVTWDDTRHFVIPLSFLRRNCPCAHCMEERASHHATFIPLFTKDALNLSSLLPIGSYAVQMIWGDGHATGIFTFPYLLSLCLENSTSSEKG